MIKDIVKKFIPDFLIDRYHLFLSAIGAFLYGFPSKGMIIIGVTGTNGKTTVIDLTVRILEEAGYKVASLSSIEFKIHEKTWQNTLKMTMPGRLKLQKFLSQALNADCQYVVLEVTSEGIKQCRHRFVDFNVAVFTNLTPEHIESHGSFEKYKKAKGKLFKICSKLHIINLDDKNAGSFLEFPADKKYGYSLNDGRWIAPNLEKVEARNYQLLSNGSKFFIGDTEFRLNLLGKFNIYNALAAICIALSQGVALGSCKKALEKAEGCAGRIEEVIAKPFKVFVDYAFTPAALEQVYETIHNPLFQISPNSKLICVLGSCGGGRDKWKRPVLGEIAGKYCDEIIITNEDPYDEDPAEIIKQVAEGAGAKAKKISDRRQAIKKALSLAKAGDVVMITGTGCEPWMCVANGKKIPWDDRRVVREEFKKLKRII